MTRRVCILGVGKSGVAAARHCVESGDEVRIYAGARSERGEAAAAPFIERGVDVVFDSENVEGHYDLCVVCPGIPQTGSFFQSAREASDEIISEPEFAWRISPADWIAITGTNGKTTTTALISHVLETCGTPAFSCGNIGETCTEAVEHRRADEYLIAEMSSYQLASIDGFKPEVAVLLNITPDHLSWHGSLEAYAEAKLRIFENQSVGNIAVICDEVPHSARIACELRGRGIKVVNVGSNSKSDCAYVDDENRLCVDFDGTQHLLCTVDELAIKGAHNVMNALVAASVAVSLDVATSESLASALTTFEPLEHRIEPSGVIDGVEFFNDSKATNPEATLQALTAFPGHPILLMLGGRDKGTDLTELVEACKPVCRTVYTYGEAGERFHEAFVGSGIELISAATMREAFDKAERHAEPGDVVLLSPSCASFDEFDSFNHRGEVFKQLVADKSNSR